jgi:hypothetical protein
MTNRVHAPDFAHSTKVEQYQSGLRTVMRRGRPGRKANPGKTGNRGNTGNTGNTDIARTSPFIAPDKARAFSLASVAPLWQIGAKVRHERSSAEETP